MDSTAIRQKLYDYIRLASDKKLNAIYDLLEDEIVEINEWWEDKQFVEELDSRYNDLETGKDKGFTIKQLEKSIEKIRTKGYEK